jgi:hypothetical protein
VLKEELAFCLVLGQVYDALSFSRLTLEYFLVCFDKFMFIKTNLSFEYA